MANKRILKKEIKLVCESLLTVSIAQSLYDSVDMGNVEALLYSILKTQSEYLCRVSHVEPGVKAKQYFQCLIKDFDTDVSNIIDQINNLH